MSYKEVYAPQLNQLKEHLKTFEDKQEASQAWKYFNRVLMLNHYYDSLRLDYPMDALEFAYGNLCSQVAIILPSYQDVGGRIFIDALKELMKKSCTPTYGIHLYEFAVLSYEKGAFDLDCVDAISTELGIIKPKHVISLVPMSLSDADMTFIDMKESKWQTVTSSSPHLLELLDLLKSYQTH